MDFNEEIYQNYRLDLEPQRVVIKNAADWESRCEDLSEYVENHADSLSNEQYSDLRALADNLSNFVPELIQFTKD